MRRPVVAVALLPVFAITLLVGSALPVGASTHPVAGTYKWYVQGITVQTVVLLRNHTAGSPNSGTWSVSRGVISVRLQGASAGAFECEKYGQPPDCAYNAVSAGRKTSTGIASHSSPGTWTGYIGSLPLVTESFYAVRTGP